MNELIAWLASQGEMPFNEFVTQARANGLRPELWRSAKRQGLLVARIEGHYVDPENTSSDFIIDGHYISAA
jgi:hypothetical protein